MRLLKKVIPAIDTIMAVYTVSCVMMKVFKWYQAKHGDKKEAN